MGGSGGRGVKVVREAVLLVLLLVVAAKMMTRAARQVDAAPVFGRDLYSNNGDPSANFGVTGGKGEHREGKMERKKGVT